MSIDSFAPPSAFDPRFMPVGQTTSPAWRTRVSRWARLLGCLMQLYLHARQMLVGRVARGGGDERRRWARRLLAALDVEVSLHGHVPAADAPLLVVANHISWLDSYAINTATRARFVAKSDVDTWPVVGSIARAFDTFFLKRGSCRAAARMVGTLAEALARGGQVAVFPEGTTSWGGGLLRFYPALFQAAVMSGARIQPVAVRYRDGDGRRSEAPAYVGDMSVLDTVRRIVREPRLVAELVFCAPIDPSGRTRRELAALARSAIAAALAIDDGDDAVAPTPLRRAA